MEFIRNNLLLIAVAFISGGMLLWPLVRRGAGGPWVNTVQATQLINREDAVVIDVRDQAEFAQGHILGAKNLPLSDLARDAAPLERYKGRALIVCCATGNRSSRAIGLLKARGHERAVNLAGGFGAWREAGLPVER